MLRSKGIMPNYISFQKLKEFIILSSLCNFQLLECNTEGNIGNRNITFLGGKRVNEPIHSLQNL